MPAGCHRDGPTLRVLVWGAGPVGLLLGATLAQAGADVLYWGRPALLETLRGGFIIRRGRREKESGPLRPVYDLAEVLRAGPFDWTLASFKSFHNNKALAQAPQIPSRHWLVVQNGLGNEEAFVRAGLCVAGGALTCSVYWLAPGILQVGHGGIGLAPAMEAVELATAFQRGGMKVRLYPRWEAMKGSKWLLNLLANPIAAVLGLPPASYLAQTEGIALEKTLLREAMDLLSALSLPLVDLPGFPVRFLRLLPFFPAPAWQTLLVRGRGGKLSSFLLDRRAGRPLEREAMLSRPLAMAGVLGLRLPLMAMLDRALSSDESLAGELQGQPGVLYRRYREMLAESKQPST